MSWNWPNSADVANYATAAAALVAIAAIVVGAWQFKAQSLLHREATAKSIFRDYLMSAVDHPRFASPQLAEIDFRRETLDGSKDAYQRYTWFVAVLLQACDQILQLSPNEAWKRSLQTQLTYHWPYLQKDFAALRGEYSQTLGALVDEVLRDKKLVTGKPLSNLALKVAQNVFGKIM